MSEGILLPTAPRDQLLDEPARVARLSAALPQIRAVVMDEDDAVALQATLACLLWEALPQASWCGFYRRVDEHTLAVGPYQGSMGCLRIDFARGVCGAAARTGTTQRVPDVHAFAGHIACDARTRSELVIPVLGHGRVRAVLDLDSPFLDAFGARESALLEQLVRDTFERASVRW